MRQRKPILFLIYALVLIVFFASISSLLKPPGLPQVEKYSEVLELFENEQVSSFSIKDGVLTLHFHEPYNGTKVAEHQLANFSVFYADLDDLIHQQRQDGILTEYQYEPSTQTHWLVSLLPSIVLFAVMMVVWFFLVRKIDRKSVV